MNTSFRTLCFLVVAIVCSTPAKAESADPFDALDALLDDNLDTIDRNLEEQYQRLDEAMEEAYQRLAKQVEATWGKDDVQLPGKTVWVDYSEDMKTRRIMDFETGTLTLERIIDITEGADAIIADLARAASAARTDTTTDLAAKDLALKIARESLQKEGIELVPPPPEKNKAPVMAGVADSPSVAQITNIVSEAFSASQKQKKVTVKVPFRPGYGSTLADRYLEDVVEQAERQSLSPSLLLAVMETESSFNPRATSGVPAYGLMQLVPRSGGMDAYEHVYGEQLLLDPEYLYNPSQNVELGSAYLNLLDTRYLRAIENPETRLLCAIAAYNTGAGNVARSFTGNTNVSQAAVIINEMTPSEVYNHLRTELPFEETRNYIRKVTEAQKKYAAYDGGR